MKWIPVAIFPLLLPLLAGMPVSALDSAEQKCVQTLHQGLLKLASVQDGVIRKCHARAAAGKLAESLVSCRDDSEKVARAAARAEQKAAKSCAAPPAFGPSDAAITGAAAITGSVATAAAIFGPNLQRALTLRSENPATAKCQKKLLKATQRCAATHRAEFARCARDGIAGKRGPEGAALPFASATDLSACAGHDPRGRVAKRCGEPLAKAARRCAEVGLDLAANLTCAEADADAASACIARNVGGAACESFVIAGELPLACAAATGPRRGTLLALSYNVAGLPESLSGSMPETFTPLISPLLNGYDLVVVQESWLTPDPNPFDPLRTYHEVLVVDANHPHKSIPKPAPAGTDPARPTAILSDGLNRFSHVPFTGADRVPWTECFGVAASGSDCLALKGFSMARTSLAPGIPVDVYNLHMEAGGNDEDDQVRANQVTQLVDYIALNSAGNAVIVAGDFNLHSDGPPDDVPFQALLDGSGLQDVCVAVGCPDTNRIDKFLFRNSDTLQLTPLSWNFETDLFVAPGGEPLSDHDPLAVEFLWEEITGS